MTPAQLLRLYPRHWRQRYGDEFLALLASTSITGRVVLDVARSAAREWYERTYTVRVLLAPVVTTAGLWSAAALTKLIPSSPTITLVDGQQLVSPPWPTALGFLFPIVMFMAMVPTLSAYITPHRIRMQFTTTFWVLAAYVGVATSAWGDMVAWYGTGVPAHSWSYIWWYHAIFVLNCLTFPQIAPTQARQFIASKTWWPPEA